VVGKLVDGGVRKPTGGAGGVVEGLSKTRITANSSFLNCV